MSEIELERFGDKPWSFYLLKQDEIIERDENGDVVMEKLKDNEGKEVERPKIRHPEHISIHKGFDTSVAKVKEYIAEGIPAPKIMVAEVTIEMDDKGTSIKATQIPWSVLFEKAFR